MNRDEIGQYVLSRHRNLVKIGYLFAVEIYPNIDDVALGPVNRYLGFVTRIYFVNGLFFEIKALTLLKSNGISEIVPSNMYARNYMREATVINM